MWVSEQTASLDGVWLRERKSKLSKIPSICEALDQALLFDRLLVFHSDCDTLRGGYQIHSREEKTDSERLSNLTKVTRLAVGLA